MAQTKHEKIESKKEKELKQNILFYVSNLDLTELKILEKISFELANNYSESYKEWRRKNNQ